MPYTRKQNKLFWAAAKDPAIAAKHGLSQHEAEKMAKEGVKRKSRKGILHRQG